jgi:hypothetical protein
MVYAFVIAGVLFLLGIGILASDRIWFRKALDQTGENGMEPQR